MICPIYNQSTIVTVDALWLREFYILVCGFTLVRARETIFVKNKHPMFIFRGQSKAQSRHLRLLPSPQVAANQLGLNSRVPSRMIYQTDGAPAKVVLGNWQIVFRCNPGRRLALAGRASGLVAQALRGVGRDKVTTDVIEYLRHRVDAADFPPNHPTE